MQIPHFCIFTQKRVSNLLKKADIYKFYNMIEMKQKKYNVPIQKYAIKQKKSATNFKDFSQQHNLQNVSK